MALRVKIIATDSASRVLLKVGRGVKRLGTKFAKFGAIAGAAVGGVGLKLAADMDKGLREIGTLMGGLTDKEMKNMGDELMRVASTSGQAMKSLTKARYDIVSAGFNTAASSMRVMDESARLAVGGVTEVATAADLLTTTLNAYGKTSKDVTKVSDKLFTIVRLGKTTVNEIAGSFGRVAAIAAPAGVNLDELGAAMAVLTARGQSTEEATTAVRSAIVELMKPSGELQDALAKVGIESTQALLQQEGLKGALEAVKKASENSGLSIVDLISNIRSMQAILPLAGDGADDFSKALDDMQKSSGATAKAVEEMNKAVSVKMSKLKQNVLNAMRVLGGKILENIADPIDNINLYFENIGRIGWGELGNYISDNMTIVMEMMNRIVGHMVKPIPKTIMAAFKMAVKLAVGAFKLGLHALSEIQWKDVFFPDDQKKAAIQASQGMIKEWGDSGLKAAQGLFDKGWITGDLKKVFGDARKIAETEGVQSGKDYVYNYFGDMGSSGRAQLANVFTSWATTQKGWTTALTGEAKQQLKQGFGDFKMPALMDEEAVFAEMASWAQEWGKSIGLVGTELEAFADKFLAIHKDKLTPPSPSDGDGDDEGDAAAKAAAAALLLEESKNAKLKSLYSERQQALIDSYSFGAEKILTLQEQFNSIDIEQFTLTWDQKIAKINEMRDKFVAAKVDETEADAWAKEQTRQIENEKSQLINQGFQNAASAIEGVAAINKNASKENFAVWKAAAKVQAVVDTYAGATAAYKSLAGIPVVGPALGFAAAAAAVAAGMQRVAQIDAAKYQPKKAMGGMISGQRGSDNVPAMLTSGEFVINRQSVQTAGQENLERINETGQIGSQDQQVINISTFDSAGLENYVRMNPEEFARAFNVAKNSGYLEME